jgi:hypothetical protein
MKKILIPIFTWINKLGWLIVLIAVLLAYLDISRKVNAVKLQSVEVESQIEEVQRYLESVSSQLADLSTQIQNIDDNLENVPNYGQ